MFVSRVQGHNQHFASVPIRYIKITRCWQASIVLRIYSIIKMQSRTVTCLYQYPPCKVIFPFLMVKSQLSSLQFSNFVKTERHLLPFSAQHLTVLTILLFSRLHVISFPIKYYKATVQQTNSCALQFCQEIMAFPFLLQLVVNTHLSSLESSSSVCI